MIAPTRLRKHIMKFGFWTDEVCDVLKFNRKIVTYKLVIGDAPYCSICLLSDNILLRKYLHYTFETDDIR